ncbi:MAG: T9SS type A sorting domain-containing protein, partial [Saprospiraceae bacterium]
CFKTENSSHHYRLVGLEISIDTLVLNSYGLVVLGDASKGQGTLSVVPHDFIIDRCYIHGHSNATIMKSGVILNCANSAVLDSYISDFHSIGYDTYAIGGTNGPGPFIIRNNYLEAAGENIIFGGAAASIPNLVPSDIEIRNNHFFKPLQWRTTHPLYNGKHWTIKNLFELKTGKRVLLDGNIFENCWADLPIGQSGYAILLTVRSEGGASPQADVSDITISNNIIKHVGSGISLSGRDSPSPSLQSKRIQIVNNLFDDINGAKYGDQNIDGPNDGIFLKIGEPDDVIIDHNTVFQSGAITWAYDTTLNISITNNIFNCFLSAGGYQGIYGPGFAQGGNGPMGNFFPNIKDLNKKFNKNVLIGGPINKYTNYNTISNNYFPLGQNDVKFVDYNGGLNNYLNYTLNRSSPYYLNGIDNKDIGVDFVLLKQALEKTSDCLNTIVENEHLEHQINIYPNPIHDHLMIIGNELMDNGDFIITDLFGNQVKRFQHLFGNSIDLKIENIPTGIYFYNILVNRTLHSKGKIIIY